MKRIGAAAVVALAATLFFVAPAAGSSDAKPQVPPPAPPTQPVTPSGPPASVPPVTAPPASEPPAQRPAPPANAGSDVAAAAKGLGGTMSAIAKTTDGSAKPEAIQAAADAHRQAVEDAAAAAKDGTHGAGGDGTNGATDVAAGAGGNAQNARGLGAEVSALARTLDGARGDAVSALAKTHGDIARDGAHLLTNGGTGVASIDDPDLVLESGLLPDDDSLSGGAPLLDASFVQLTA